MRRGEFCLRRFKTAKSSRAALFHETRLLTQITLGDMPGRRRVEDIPLGTWFREVDWILGHVGRYRHIKIAETELTALFQATRGRGTRPVADAAVRKSVNDYLASEREAQRGPSQSGCLAYMKIHLSGATRAQILPVYRGLEPSKPPGRPRKKYPPE